MKLHSLNFQQRRRVIGVILVTLKGRKGSWGMFTDILYLDLGDTEKASRDFTVGPGELPAEVNAKLNFACERSQFRRTIPGRNFSVVTSLWHRERHPPREAHAS